MNKKYHVKIITRVPFPYGMAATNRVIKYAQCLNISGIDNEVYIINSTYNKPTKNVSQGIYKGIRFRYCRSCIRSSSLFKRKINDLRDFFSACLEISRDRKTDVNYIYISSFLIEFVFVILSKIRGIKTVRELCEYPYYKKCFMATITLKILFPLYDGFVAISENLYKVAEQHKKESAKIIRLPILIDKTEITSIMPYKHSKPYIFHGGTLTESKDALISSMRAFALANNALHNNIDFIIAGPPSTDLPKIKEIIKDNGLESNVIFLGQITHDKVLEYLAGASLCILNKNDTLQNQCGFSTKLSDILISETAVITTYIGEAPNWLKDGESAYITEPNQPNLIADLIVKAFENEENRKRIAHNGKEIAINNFAVTAQGPRLANFIKTQL